MFYWCSTCFTCFTALPMGTSKNCSVNGSNEPSDNFPARLRGQSKWNEQMLISKTWPVLTAHISCPSLYAPYHSSPKIHAYINSKFPVQRRSKHTLAPITLKSGLVANVHLWYPRQTMQYLGPGIVASFLCIFRKRFTSGRQMHSRMKPGSPAMMNHGDHSLYFGHASIILTQNEEVLTARVTLSGSNWKENPLHLIDASRSAGLIFRLMFYKVAFSTFQTGSAVQS